MNATGRSAATLAVLSAVLVAAVLWGFAQTTKPFPGSVEVPTCVEVAVPTGDRVTPSDVTVSVLNAGTREGLAGRTMQLFSDAGFGVGDSGNAPEGTEVPYAQIWTDDPDNPAVKLVASRIRGAQVNQTPSDAAGVTVVVGDDFAELVDGRKRVKAKTDTTICSPPT